MDRRRQVSLVMGFWLVVVAAIMISSHGSCAEARRGAENQPQQEEQRLEMVGEKDQPLELVGEAYYFELGDTPADYVNPHNNARRAVGANIPNLSWSATLADFARNWAETRARAGCNLIHSGGKYGENIYWSSWQSTPADAVNSWVSEKQWYNYNSNSCASGQVCGHYTQVVWRDTRSVGCGSATCSGGGKFVVCSYDPPGNWIGQKPY